MWNLCRTDLLISDKNIDTARLCFFNPFLTVPFNDEATHDVAQSQCKTWIVKDVDKNTDQTAKF